MATGTTNAALKMIEKSEKKWSEKQVLNFGGLAVYAYCKEHLPEQARLGNRLDIVRQDPAWWMS